MIFRLPKFPFKLGADIVTIVYSNSLLALSVSFLLQSRTYVTDEPIFTRLNNRLSLRASYEKDDCIVQFSSNALDFQRPMVCSNVYNTNEEASHTSIFAGRESGRDRDSSG